MLEQLLFEYQMNRDYRDQMEKRAENERFLSSLANREEGDTTNLSKSMLAWTGRRLMESGNFLLSLAEQPAFDQPVTE